jgi:hypothetical protein
MRVPEHLQRGQHRRARPQVTREPSVGRNRLSLPRRDEREDAVDLLRRRGGVRGGGQLARRGRRRAERRAQPGAGGGLKIGQAHRVPEILPVDEIPIEPVDLLERDSVALRPEGEVRAPQQLDEGATREVRGDRAEDQIHGRGKRLRRQRKGVERLVWHLSVLEHLAREIQVRQRPLEDNRGPAKRRGARGAFQSARELGQLLFAVPAHEGSLQLGARRGTWNDQRGRRKRRACPGVCLAPCLAACLAEAAKRRRRAKQRRRVEPHIFDSRQEMLVQAQVVPGFEDRLRRDDIDRLDARHPREQIEIRGPEPAAVRGLVRDGDDQLSIERPRRRERQRAHAVLVDTRDAGQRPLELLEGRREKHRLRQQPCRAAIVRSARLQCAGHQAIEIRHGLVPPPQLIVERENLADEAGTQIERRLRPFCAGRVRGPPQQDLTVERRQGRRRAGQPFPQPRMELVARDDVGQRARGAGRHNQILDRPPQLFRRTA